MIFFSAAKSLMKKKKNNLSNLVPSEDIEPALHVVGPVQMEMTRIKLSSMQEVTAAWYFQMHLTPKKSR